MSDITPGPWQRIGWNPCGIYGPGDLGTAERICHLDGRQEHDANARLIAAAPDMLAALKMVLQHGRIDDSESRMNAVAAAISKAEPR